MRRSGRFAFATLLALAAGGSAHADHAPKPLAPTSPGLPGVDLLTFGTGDWTHVVNIPPNPGSDNTVFRLQPTGPLYGVVGTLGQGSALHVGQRFLQLTDVADGVETVDPRWLVDFGSAACAPSANVLSLQHDNAVVYRDRSAQLLVDTSDSSGRCHDPSGGGLEIVDISGLGAEGALPAEVGLLRLANASHTVTADPTRDGIVYNSHAWGSGWIDVVDVRSCWNGDTLEDKRTACAPKVYRMDFDANALAAPATGCHDITVVGNRLYCAGIAKTIILDISGLFDAEGNVDGVEHPCTRGLAANGSGASVTDCTGAPPADGSAGAKGWKVLGAIAHAGTSTSPAATEIQVSHEAKPTPDGRFLFVTDERGGGVTPPSASCIPLVDNPVGNGGVHVFDISDPANPKYASLQDGDDDPSNDPRAVFRGHALLPAATFCTSHRMELVPGENRFLIAWYSQGIKIVDYYIDDAGRWRFEERAALALPLTTAWTANPFKAEYHADGTVTYHILVSDITRGIDVVTWTGEANRTPPIDEPDAGMPDGNGGPDAGAPDGGDDGGGGGRRLTGGGFTGCAVGADLGGAATGAAPLALLALAVLLRRRRR